jgi:hypothetical protein
MCEHRKNICTKDMKIINEAMEESERADSVCARICPKLWQSQQRTAANGRFDVFACKENFATDMYMIRPYSDSELKAALIEHCKSANRSSIEWYLGGEICSGYDRLREVN